MNVLYRLTALVVLLTLAPGALAQSLAPRVFPNPISAERAVTVEVADVEAATVEVVDVLGRVLSLDAPLAAGTYLVRVRYADGRELAPAPVTVATPGPVELRLTEAASGATWVEPGPTQQPQAANKTLACSNDEIFGGFYLQENVGTLTPRPDLSPASMRVKTVGPTNNASFTTCFGEVQGTAWRYVAGGDPGNRPMRILSPTFVGNTFVDYEVLGNDGIGSFTANYGWQEVDVSGTPASQFLLNTPFFPGLGQFELIILDDGAVVHRQSYDGAVAGLYVSSKGVDGQINLLRSILMSSIVDGFQVTGGTKPGDVSFVFEMESGDGADVNVHAGVGAPIVGSGDVIHITPKFSFPNPFDLVINEMITTVAGMNRYGIRGLRFAVGGSTDPFLGSEAQFSRSSQEALGPQHNPIFDAQTPLMNVTGSVFGAPDVYGIQFGRLPGALEEVGSDEMAVLHGPVVFNKGGGPQGVFLDDTGEYYRTIDLVRNETDVEGETITAQIDNTGGGVSLTVTNDNGTFGTYQFVYDADADGTNDIVATYPVGVPQNFSPNAITVIASGASDFDDQYNDAGSTQDFLVGFLVDIGNGNGGIVYIFPNWTSANADVDVRAHTVEANQPWDVVGLRERDETDPPAPLTLFGEPSSQRRVVIR